MPIKLDENKDSIEIKKYVINSTVHFDNHENGSKVLNFLVRKQGHVTYKIIGVNIKTFDIYGYGSGEYSADKLPKYLKDDLIKRTKEVNQY